MSFSPTGSLDFSAKPLPGAAAGCQRLMQPTCFGVVSSRLAAVGPRELESAGDQEGKTKPHYGAEQDWGGGKSDKWETFPGPQAGKGRTEAALCPFSP